MIIRSEIRRVSGFALDLLFPRTCAGCGREGRFLCGECSDTLKQVEPPICACCGLPLERRVVCPDCHDMPFAIDGIRSAYRHTDLARDLVRSLKYNNVKALAAPLARLMSQYMEANPLPADVIVAVPTHPKRIRKRGYNQAELLAGELSRFTGLPKAIGSLTRPRNTPPQVRLGATDRRANVEGAFLCTNGAFANRRVLLIDDVCTTGATLNSCAIALKEAGAASVWGLTLSREC